MCGIVGSYGPNNAVSVDEMLSCIEHRGPDEEGKLVTEGGDLKMGARRLSIVDLAGGSQPIYNEDRSVAVVYNGEIYNYRELRADLQSRGHHFETDSDTEVLVHLWEEYGEKFPQRLNGMFAFSLYDSDRGCLFLARDRLGVKPLYYSTGDGIFTWASEVNGLLAGNVSRAIDPQAVYDFFALGYTPHPRTMFEDIRKVQPGTSLLVTEGGANISRRRYWSLPTCNADAQSLSRSAVSSRVRNLLEQSVNRRLMADVPLGAFLSGGLDSSAVVGLLSERVDDLRTFSVGFQGDQYDESDEAEFVADHFGTTHTTIDIDLSSMDAFGAAVKQYGEPLADPAILPTMLLSERTSEDLKVVHTGEGADELFAGYDRFRSFDEQRQRYERIPRSAFRVAGFLAEHTPVERLRPYFEYLHAQHSDSTSLVGDIRGYRTRPEHYLDIDDATQADFQEMVAEPFREAVGDRIRGLTGLQLSHPLVDRLLYKVDHATMAHSLEARVPYLDHELVEFAYCIPDEYKLESGYKPILNRAVANLVPDRTRNRSEHGFGVPTTRWFRERHESIDRYLSEEALDQVPYLDSDYVFDEWAAHRREQRDVSMFLWRCLNYAAWYHEVARP